MTGQGVFTLRKKRQGEQTYKREILWVAIAGEPDHHPLMTVGRLRPVCAEQSVPPGKVEAEIAVRLLDDDRMVDPVHVRRDEEQSEPPVELPPHTDISVIEHARAVENDLE